MVATNNPISLSFYYNGKPCTGYLLSSLEMEPYYHWFFFEDAEIIDRVDDCIAFLMEDGVLKPVHPYYGHEELILIIRQLVEQQLEETVTS